MAHDSLGRLAQELKHFLASQDEDEFIIPAAAGSAPPMFHVRQKIRLRLLCPKILPVWQKAKH